jgi:hypothetical protein
MDRYKEAETYFNIALHSGLLLAIIMDPYGGPDTALIIDLHRGL